MNNFIKIIGQYWKTIFWAVLIVLLSTMPVQRIPGTRLFDIPHFDKFVHFSLYATLTTLWLIDYFKNTYNLSAVRVVFIILISISYGAMMELVQKVFIQQRSGDWFDFLANTTGIFVALLLFRYYIFYRKSMLKIFANRWIKKDLELK